MINKGYHKKEPLIFLGVLRLIEEGVDLHRVKVQDIASAAGIGKGTLYEYFSSKEEIIAETLMYMLHQEIEQLSAKICSDNRFDDILTDLYDYICQIPAPTVRIMTSLFHLTHGNTQLTERIQTECMPLIQQAVSRLIEQGRNDGSISSSCPDEYCKFVLYSAFATISPKCAENQETFLPNKEYFFRMIHSAMSA